MQTSRNVIRRALFHISLRQVNEKNLKQLGESRYSGMRRRERRKLARAYAAKQWHEMRSVAPAA